MIQRHRFNTLITLFCTLLVLAALPAIGEPSKAAEAGLQKLADATSGHAKVSMNKATGTASFVRLPAEISRSAVTGVSLQDKAASFLGEYGSAFGVKDTARELVYIGAKSSPALTHLSYHQTYKGVPVFAGMLRAHFDRGGDLVAVNGAFVPDLDLSAAPTWSAEAAAKVAINDVQRIKAPGIGKALNLLSAADSKLYVFHSGLLQGVPGKAHLAWEVEVVNETRTVREFVYVDAHFGKVIDRITGIHEAHDFHREVSETTLANVVWVEGDTFPTGNTDWDNEILGAGETYNIFASMTNGSYLSYDGANAHMRTVNNDPNIQCPNANWNGISANYCTGVTGDDTVGHEWGHAYTEYTNNLIYQWQSGALNEAYSDMWGEVVDFENGRGSDTPGGLRAANGANCSKFGSGPKRKDNTYRWLSGEDDPAFNGAIRDMWRPPCYGDPGKVTDGQYHCLTSDSGGVHINSGVPNHGFALTVDGGTYNGVSISGIGLTKTARIFWEAQNLLTPASKFADHADALDTACAALIGATLYELDASSPNGTVSAQVISAADCTEVDNANDAVELRTDPSQCNFQPLLAANPPALCGGGTVTTVLLEDWESGSLPAGWSVSNAPVNPPTFSTADWAVVGSLPKGEPGSAAFVEDLNAGDCVTDIEAGTLQLDSPVIALPATGNPNIAFDHYVATEQGWDGGNVKIDVNNSGFSLVPSSAYDFNAYNSSLETVANGNDNPMAGQAAFTGTDGGEVDGTWGQSQIDLAGIASAGDDIQIRFELGVDGCAGIDGWYVDEVHVHTCGSGGGFCGDNNIDAGETCDGTALGGESCISQGCTGGTLACDANCLGFDTSSCTGCGGGTCGNGVCDPGEDCTTCSDCAGQLNGKPSNRFCCGNGIAEGPEGGGAICDGNF